MNNKYTYYDNQTVRLHEIVNDMGEHHNENGKPAYISFFPNGNIRYEIYYKNGKYYRDNNEPTVIDYFENGQIKCMKYQKDLFEFNDIDDNDNYFNEDNYNWIEYYENGNIKCKRYIRNNIKDILKKPIEKRNTDIIFFSEDGEWEKHLIIVPNKDIANEYISEKELYRLLITDDIFRIIEKNKNMIQYTKIINLFDLFSKAKR